MEKGPIVIKEFVVEEPRSLSEQLYDHLRAQIIAGRYRPGERLNESRIAGEFKLSRITVREATRRLEQEGLVVTRPRSGPAVIELDPRDVHDLYMVRIALEVMAVEQAMQRDTTDLIEQLEQIVAEMSQAARVEDEAGALSLDLSFHETLVAASGNRILIDTYDSITARLRLVIYHDWHYITPMAETFARQAKQHAEIITALRGTRLEQVTEAVRIHITHALDLVLARETHQNGGGD